MGQGKQSSFSAAALVQVWADPGASYRTYLGTSTAPCVLPADPSLASSGSRSEGDTASSALSLPGWRVRRPHESVSSLTRIPLKSHTSSYPILWGHKLARGALPRKAKGHSPGSFQTEAQPQASRRRVGLRVLLCILRSWKDFIQF